jgi:3'-phosphoadenosine 5'-phosphosulfate (PAPS) 3'-phosphatase
VASGKADLYPGFGQTCEWDIAAGHAILRAAGGDVVTLEGDAIPYGNRDKKFLNPKFLARSNYIA